MGDSYFHNLFLGSNRTGPSSSSYCFSLCAILALLYPLNSVPSLLPKQAALVLFSQTVCSFSMFQLKFMHLFNVLSNYILRSRIFQ